MERGADFCYTKIKERGADFANNISKSILLAFLLTN
jgi:hypothetical protein